MSKKSRNKYISNPSRESYRFEDKFVQKGDRSNFNEREDVINNKEEEFTSQLSMKQNEDGYQVTGINIVKFLLDRKMNA